MLFDSGWFNDRALVLLAAHPVLVFLLIGDALKDGGGQLGFFLLVQSAAFAISLGLRLRRAFAFTLALLLAVFLS